MAEAGDAVKSVTSFPEDIRSCSLLKIEICILGPQRDAGFQSSTEISGKVRT